MQNKISARGLERDTIQFCDTSVSLLSVKAIVVKINSNKQDKELYRKSLIRMLHDAK